MKDTKQIIATNNGQVVGAGTVKIQRVIYGNDYKNAKIEAHIESVVLDYEYPDQYGL